MSKRVTVVCCTNNYNQLNDELIKSLSIQIEDYELIIIDNCKNVFSSCSKALNSAIKDIKTKYVVFSHQDIILKDEYSLKRFVDYMQSENIGDIYGVAGTNLEKRGVLTAITHGTNKHAAGGRHLDGIAKCDVIDECFFGGKTQTFIEYPFDEILCDNWHLYAVDRCLNNRLHGGNVYVCAIDLIHTSTGTLNRSFNLNFLNLCKKYKTNYKEIYTTCDRSKTGFIPRYIHFFRAEYLRIKKGWKNEKKINS